MGSHEIFLKSSNYFGRVMWPDATLSYSSGRMLLTQFYFDKMATECISYFTLNGVNLGIAMASLCHMVTETKSRF